MARLFMLYAGWFPPARTCDGLKPKIESSKLSKSAHAWPPGVAFSLFLTKSGPNTDRSARFFDPYAAKSGRNGVRQSENAGLCRACGVLYRCQPFVVAPYFDAGCLGRCPAADSAVRADVIWYEDAAGRRVPAVYARAGSAGERAVAALLLVGVGEPVPYVDVAQRKPFRTPNAFLKAVW